MKVNFKNLNKKQAVILIAVIAVVLVIILPFGIYSVVNSETPSQVFEDIFVPNSKQIIGKWQDEKGITGYEFFDDNTYDYHLSTYSYTKDYKISGNKITLVDYNSNASVVYKFNINGDKMKFTLVESENQKAEEKETVTLVKVKNFNLKKPIDVLKEFAEEAKKETASDDEKKEDTTKAEEQKEEKE